MSLGRRPLRVLISSGPTREPLDPVRFLSNYSTGFMGAQLAAEALKRGHRVTVVSGPGVEPLPARARVIPVEHASEMERALRQQAPRADAVIMAAAVSDFTPQYRQARKLRRGAPLRLRLKPTPDIIARLPRRRGQIRVGFALETGQVLARAARKLRGKRLDLLLAQDAGASGGPFGRRAVRAWLLERNGTVTALGRRAKRNIARALLDKTESLWYGQLRATASRKRA